MWGHAAHFARFFVCTAKPGCRLPPATSKSTVKQINQRVKGSKKFWSESGGEALLQLRADQLSDTAPVQISWFRRVRRATGTSTDDRKCRAAAA